MPIVNIHDAKTRLSQLLRQVERGETVVIARAGKPIAQLSPIEEATFGKRLGFMKGSSGTPDDFDTLHSEELADLFEGVFQ